MFTVAEMDQMVSGNGYLRDGGTGCGCGFIIKARFVCWWGFVQNIFSIVVINIYIYRCVNLDDVYLYVFEFCLITKTYIIIND